MPSPDFAVQSVGHGGNKALHLQKLSAEKARVENRKRKAGTLAAYFFSILHFSCRAWTLRQSYKIKIMRSQAFEGTDQPERGPDIFSAVWRET